MRKIGLILALIVMLAGVSVQAQKKTVRPRLSPPTPDLTLIIIQDDAGGGYFAFDPISGDYKCVLCEYDYELRGNGTVKIDGCNIYFTVLNDGYRMFASTNICDHQAKCAVEVFAPPDVRYPIEPILEYWSDSDMRDNTAECKTKGEGK